MMNFPDAPSVGSSYTPAGTGITYKYDGIAWNITDMSRLSTISDTPPAGPYVGQFWFESSTGALFVWYDDGNSQQWVQVNATSN